MWTCADVVHFGPLSSVSASCAHLSVDGCNPVAFKFRMLLAEMPRHQPQGPRVARYPFGWTQAPQVRHVVPYRGGLLASAIALKLSAYVQSMFRDEGTGHLFTTMAYTSISLSLSLFATSPNLQTFMITTGPQHLPHHGIFHFGGMTLNHGRISHQGKRRIHNHPSCLQHPLLCPILCNDHNATYDVLQEVRYSSVPTSALAPSDLARIGFCLRRKPRRYRRSPHRWS